MSTDESKSKWEAENIGLFQYHPKIAEMTAACREFAGRLYRNQRENRQLVLVGDSGCGKTHAARAILWWWRNAAFSAYAAGHWEAPGTTFYAEWPKLCLGFEEGQFGVIDDLCHTRGLVVIDDVGAEHDPFKKWADKLCQSLNRDDRWRIVTTNIAPSEWGKRLDARISDRLIRNSVVVNLTGVPSYAVWQIQQQRKAA
jgi:DNA replication protein DnaC